MKRKTKLKTIPDGASPQDVVNLLKRERTLLKKQRREIEALLKSLQHSTKWATGTEESWEGLLGTIEATIADIDNHVGYLDEQLTVLKKAVKAFEADDPEAIKAAAKDYLFSDMSISLKNLALHRYDNTEIIKLIADYEAS